jgi:2-polyprenyl-3-methyl-5-hydroxy-6-metoxy-1,4-benzoquinol methylase
VTEHYAERYHNIDFQGSLPPVEEFLRVRGRGQEWLEDNYESLLPANKEAAILDIGCGMGEFLYFLKQRGYQKIEGVEISEHLIAYCERLVGCPVTRISDLQEFLTSHPARYDVIYLGDVIEHFPKSDLLAILDALREALRPGGILLVRTNNAAGVAGPYLRYISLTHEVCFNDLSLRKVLETVGFKRISVFGERMRLRWRPRFIVWLALRKLWFAFLNLAYLIELGTDRPRVLTRTLLAQALRE